MKKKYHSQVLFVIGSSLPAPGGGGRTRVISAAKQAKKYGYDVRLLCFFSPHHIQSLIKDKTKLHEDSGCIVHYFPRIPFRRFAFIAHINNLYCGFVVFLIAALNGIKIAHGHGFKESLYIIIAKKLTGKLAVVADIHGASLEEALYSGNIKKDDKLARVLMKTEKTVLENADRLLFVSYAMQKHFEQKRGLPFDNSSIIPCAVNEDFVIDHNCRRELRDKYDVEDKIVFCYVGSVAPYQLHKEMCLFFSRILVSIPNVFFLIISHHRNVFEKTLEANAIDSKNFLTIIVDHDNVFNFLQMADIGFLLRDDSIVNRVSSPTKFAEYCLSGVPVITTDFVGDFSAAVKNMGLGYIVDLDSMIVDQSLLSFVNQVRAHRQEYANRCTSYVRNNISWSTYGKVLACEYRFAEDFG